MKDLVRLRTSLSEEIEAVLNEQIKLEAKSSSNYLAMAGWCERNGFDHSANFFFKQVEEERAHMLKIFKYVCDIGGKAVSPEIVGINQEFDSFKGIFEDALTQEIRVTQSINNIVDRCHKAKDYTTAGFMEWFLKEQIEEEYIARRALELFDVIGEEGVGKYMIDEQIQKLTYEGA
ncbi:ferritin [soil metagenome]